MPAANFKDLTGLSFHRWTVLERGPDVSGRVHWRCQCTCGTIRLVNGVMLRDGNSKSCGCLKRERLQERQTTHGMSKTPEYHIWEKMLVRCFNPTHKHYQHYGGRGITVCERWRMSFEAFFADMGPRPSPMHSLDRYPNLNGNYEPENVRWATQHQQMRNTRRNVLLTYKGITQCLKDWADQLGVSREALRSRLNRGWTVDKILSVPVEPPPPKQPLLTYNGCTQTLTAWAHERGLPRSVLYKRLHSHGWTLERALTTPLRQQRKE